VERRSLVSNSTSAVQHVLLQPEGCIQHEQYCTLGMTLAYDQAVSCSHSVACTSRSP
jgi:hypothetical protein